MQGELPETGPTLAEALCQVMRNWYELPFPKKLISLTGGLDSRTILAAAAATSLKGDCVTLRTPYLSYGDRKTPPKLARLVNFSHEFREEAKVEPSEIVKRRKLAEDQMDGIFFHPMSNHFITGLLFDDPELVYTLGNCFALGRCYYGKRLPAEVPDTADALLARFFPCPPEPLEDWRRAIDLWLLSLRDEVALKMEWRDRFYHEQCLGSWFSTIIRAADLAASTMFFPGNCLWIFHQQLQHGPGERKSGAPQKQVIAALAPRLAGVPINPVPYHDRAKQMLRRLRRRTEGVWRR